MTRDFTTIAMKGYVYFIQINGLQPIKIGYTTDLKGTDRFDSAKTYAPFGLTYVAHIFSYNVVKLERELHKKFADKRLKGEWFDINQAQAYKIAMEYGGNAGAPMLDADSFKIDMQNKSNTGASEANIELLHQFKNGFYNQESEFTFSFLQDLKQLIGYKFFKRKDIINNDESKNLIKKYQISQQQLDRLLNPKRGYFRRINQGVYVFATKTQLQ